MVIHTQVDWRTPQQALEWDTELVRGVFWRICQSYDEASRLRLAKHRHNAKARPSENQAESADVDKHAQSSQPLDEHRLVAKADVLIGLKTTEQYLEKRPFLRSLATMLACCSNEKEMASVGNYVKYRLRERTISFVMVRDKLRDIYKKHIDLLAFEAKIEEFEAAARAKSTWCVRDPKAIGKSPSQFYGVHNIPPKPKTQKQIDMEMKVLKSHAAAVTNNAITLVVTQLVDAAQPKSRQRSAKSGGRDSLSRGNVPGKVGPSAAAKAKLKRDQQQAEVRRQELRLQVLVPGISVTRMATSFGALQRYADGSGDSDQGRSGQQKQLELLALIEATGDVSIAQQLLQQKIPCSGFTRVTEHLANLGGAGEDMAGISTEWATFKLWKTVYRSRTIQSIQRLEQ